MIQTHPPLEQRLAANRSMLNKPTPAPAQPAPKPRLDVVSADTSVHDMFAAKTRHGMAAESSRT